MSGAEVREGAGGWSPAAVDRVRAALSRDGYWVGERPFDAKDDSAAILSLARALGDLYVPDGCDPSAPVIRTRPTRESDAAPFDRPAPIGWHGDFASHADRPEISLVHVARPDPQGGTAGAWRLASVARLLDRLTETAQGRAAAEFLAAHPVPFSYAEGQPPRYFPVLERRGAATGMRFYEPSIERGCRFAYGRTPDAIGDALQVVRQAADDVAELRPTARGSMLAISNWAALHDRLRQTVSAGADGREALLVFVSACR